MLPGIHGLPPGLVLRMVAPAALLELAVIPVDEQKWHRVDPWPGLEAFPKGHRLEVTMPGDGTVIARVVGPHAHVFAEGPDFDTAIEAAVEWFESVGREL